MEPWSSSDWDQIQKGFRCNLEGGDRLPPGNLSGNLSGFEIKGRITLGNLIGFDTKGRITQGNLIGFDIKGLRTPGNLRGAERQET